MNLRAIALLSLIALALIVRASPDAPYLSGLLLLGIIGSFAYIVVNAHPEEREAKEEYVRNQAYAAESDLICLLNQLRGQGIPNEALYEVFAARWKTNFSIKGGRLQIERRALLRIGGRMNEVRRFFATHDYR